MDFSGYLTEIERLRPERVPENLVLLPVVDSTNRIARAIVQEYETEEQPLPPLLILALEQSGGRGRQGRTWTSPPGKGVYATRVLTVQNASVLQTLPLLVGVGLCRALAPLPCRLKWPNDLLVEGKKIGGILIEAMVHTEGESRALIGFGVNVSQDPAMPETSTSVDRLGGTASLEDVTWKLAEGLERELEHLGDLAYAAAAYRELSIHQPGDRITCRVGESTVEGAFVEIDDQGRLVLDNGGEGLRLSSGEVIG
ncbi:MAG: BirA family transcriptional regulator [Acidobacteriota bacterium]|jgi:BirA family biotin operon repressor/biotin-[acetyl-CoA-carboxylase] ligase|nr:BirA family transcriptional regulator [Acidobacteriota bacterium]